MKLIQNYFRLIFAWYWYFFGQVWHMDYHRSSTECSFSSLPHHLQPAPINSTLISKFPNSRVNFVHFPGGKLLIACFLGSSSLFSAGLSPISTDFNTWKQQQGFFQQQALDFDKSFSSHYTPDFSDGLCVFLYIYRWQIIYLSVVF